jgi:hypothetical protein
MMPKLKLILVLPFLTFVLTIQLLAQTPLKEGTATIAGQVTLKGEPVRGATVALSPDNRLTRFELKNVLRMKTDDAGRFRFEKVKAGLYYLGAIAPAFVSPGENRYGPQGKAINVSEGETVENFEIALKFGGVITGRITEANGNPLVGTSVELSRINEQGKPERIFLGSNGSLYGTDDRGIYRLYGLAAGRYLVSVGFAQAPNSITVTSQRTFYPKTYHPDATGEAQAKIVEVTEGQETTGVDITVGGLKKNFDVAGRVVYAETGQTVVGIEVSYGVTNTSTKNIGPYGSTGERTDSQGEFRIQNVLPGKYAVFAQPEKGSPAYSESTSFEIGDSDVGGLEVKLRRGGSISGVATFEGVNDPAALSRLSQIQLFISVTAQELGAPVRNPTAITSTGSFRFDGLRPGKVTISLSSESRAQGFSLLRIERGSTLQNEGIDLGPGEQIAGVRLILGYGTGAVRGQLKIVGGTLPGAVQLLVRARRVDSGLTASNAVSVEPPGVFRIEKLPPGEYEIVLSSYLRGDEPTAGYDELSKLIANTKQRVAITNDAEVPVILTLDLSRKEGN